MYNSVSNDSKIIASSIADNVKVYCNAIIANSILLNNVSIGDMSIIRKSELKERVEIGRRNTIESSIIDKGTYTGEFCIVKYCTIGKYCSISWNVSIGGANHNIKRLSSTPLHRIFDGGGIESYSSFRNENVMIGNDVWIAAGAHILRGVTIGDGAVIAANAVITKDVPPYTIWAGVPARQINVRFKKDISDRLLKIKWWDWPKEKLNKAKDLFDMEINEDIIDKLEIIGKEL